VKAPR